MCFVVQMTLEEDTLSREQRLLNRQVISLLPLPVDDLYVFPKVGVLAKAVSDVVSAPLKMVSNAVGLRQARQKYVRQTVRAELFLKKHRQSEIGDLPDRMLRFYRKMKYDDINVTNGSDMKKVIHLIHMNVIHAMHIEHSLKIRA